MVKFKSLRLFVVALSALSMSACNSKESKGQPDEFHADLQVYAGPKLHHWRLDIPREYIYEKSGKNGVPRYKRSTGKKNRQVIKIHAVLDPETMTISPHPNKRRGGGENFVFIQVNNGHVIKELLVDQCLNRKELSELSELPSSLNPCHDRTPNCRLYTHLDGWPISLTVPNEYFAHPEKHCSTVKSFLNDLTNGRDSLPGR